MPGIATGTVILTNACQRLAPSQRAASSSERLSPSKKLTIIHAMNGRLIAMWETTIAIRALTSTTVVTRRNSGSTSTMGGSIWLASTPTRSGAPPVRWRAAA